MTAQNVSQSGTIVHVKDITGGPGTLGLLGYGMPGVLLGLANAGLIQFDSMLLSMFIFYGGIAQFTAGLMEWKKGNTFGLTAYGSYGLFWFSFAAMLLMPELGLVPEYAGAGAMAAYLALWGIFTLVLFIGTLKFHRSLQFVIGTLAVLFFILAAGSISGNTTLVIIGGYVGIVSGLAAMYTGLSPLIHEIYAL